MTCLSPRLSLTTWNTIAQQVGTVTNNVALTPREKASQLTKFLGSPDININQRQIQVIEKAVVGLGLCLPQVLWEKEPSKWANMNYQQAREVVAAARAIETVDPKIPEHLRDWDIFLTLTKDTGRAKAFADNGETYRSCPDGTLLWQYNADPNWSSVVEQFSFLKKLFNEWLPDYEQPEGDKILFPPPYVLRKLFKERSGFELAFPRRDRKNNVLSRMEYLEYLSKERYPVLDLHDPYEHIPILLFSDSRRVSEIASACLAVGKALGLKPDSSGYWTLSSFLDLRLLNTRRFEVITPDEVIAAAVEHVVFRPNFGLSFNGFYWTELPPEDIQLAVKTLRLKNTEFSSALAERLDSGPLSPSPTSTLEHPSGGDPRVMQYMIDNKVGAITAVLEIAEQLHSKRAKSPKS